MSYYYRRAQMQKFATAMTDAVEMQVARAAMGWDESKVTRGKTTPASRGGSFAPKALHPAVAEELAAMEPMIQRKLFGGDLPSRPDLHAWAQHHMKFAMGPAHGAGHQITDLVDRLYDAYKAPGRKEYIERDEWMKHA